MKNLKIKNLDEKDIENLKQIKIVELEEMEIQDLKVLKVKIEINNKEKEQEPLKALILFFFKFCIFFLPF